MPQLANLTARVNGQVVGQMTSKRLLLMPCSLRELSTGRRVAGVSTRTLSNGGMRVTAKVLT